jgi:hypothetical protein
MYFVQMLKEASRQQIETALQRVVDKKQRELEGAAGAERDERQQEFLAALQTYTTFVVDGKVPDGYRLVKGDEDEDDDD